MSYEAASSSLVFGEYELLGKSAPLELDVEFEVADSLRQYVEWEFFPHMHTRFNRITGVVVAGATFGPAQDLGMGDEACLFSGVRTVYYSDNSWFLGVLLSRYKFDGTMNRKATQYKFGVIDNRLMEANKQIRVIRDISSLSVEAAMQDTEPVIRRLAYERPVSNRDCEIIIEHLDRTARRSQACGRLT